MTKEEIIEKATALGMVLTHYEKQEIPFYVKEFSVLGKNITVEFQDDLMYAQVCDNNLKFKVITIAEVFKLIESLIILEEVF